MANGLFDTIIGKVLHLSGDADCEHLTVRSGLTAGGVSNATVPSGAVCPFAGASAPPGWLLCDGAAYPTASYPLLFLAIGYTYGGSGATFNVPDLRGRVALGVSGSHALASSGGEETHTLSTAEMPIHRHGVSGDTGSRFIVTAAPSTLFITTAGAIEVTFVPMDDVGGSAAHNNMQPYLALNTIIKT